MPAAMSGQAERETAAVYREFAAEEAAGRSDLYARLGNGVAEDPQVLRFLAGLPAEKRQPQLLLAAARYLTGVPASYAALRAVVLDRGAELAPVMLARRVQTNEPARCATLLPALALLPQPLALLEVGASAGLCLLPDRYGYDYGTRRIAGQPGAPVLRCRCQGPGPVPLPGRPVQVAWRAGIDLNPLDVTDPDDVHWLSCLVWPGEGDRAARLAAAIEVARRDPPRVVHGDLLDRLAATAAGAPAGATLVIFHSSVLAYVSPAERQEFAQAVAGLDAVWLAQEAPAVMSSAVPGFAPAAPPAGMAYVLTRDGRDALAYADGHGTWLSWRE